MHPTDIITKLNIQRMPNSQFYDPPGGKIQSEDRPLASEIYLRGLLSVFSLCDLFGGYHKIINVEITVSVL